MLVSDTQEIGNNRASNYSWACDESTNGVRILWSITLGCDLLLLEHSCLLE